MSEKISGAAFVGKVRPKLEAMRQNFFEGTQGPFFAALDENGPGHAAIPCPLLILAGAAGQKRKKTLRRPVGCVRLLPSFVSKTSRSDQSIRRSARTVK